MTVPSVTTGRGAWTTTGKANGSRYYTYIAGKSLDGTQATKDVNWQAVNLGVKAIQARVNSYQLKNVPVLDVDGLYGKQTALAVKALQVQFGYPASGQDGVAGPTTCKRMWKDLQLWFAGVYGVPASHLYGFMMLESAGDPGAVGVTTPSDRGLSQINLTAHPSITVEQAFDPVFAINYTAKRLRDARVQFGGKTVDLMTKCSIAQHNSPLAAKQWYTTGAPPNEKIEKYVNLVLQHASQFKV